MTILALSGCAGTTSTSPGYRNPDARELADSAMSAGPLLVKIHGRPYASSQKQIEDAVLNAMGRAMSWTASPKLTADPAMAKVRSLFVVMTFNDTAVTADAQCSGDNGGGEPQSQGSVQVMASFCGESTPLSNTSGRIGESNAIDDPQFGALIAQVTEDLFPGYWQPSVGTGLYMGGGSGFGIGGGLGIGFGWW